MLKNIPKILYRLCTQKFPQPLYLQLAAKQLQKLTEIAQNHLDQKADLSSTDKILKVNLGRNFIVVNTQTPNRQLWYSSSVSGPLRFDYEGSGSGGGNGGGKWVSANLRKDIQEVFKGDLEKFQ